MSLIYTLSLLLLLHPILTSPPSTLHLPYNHTTKTLTFYTSSSHPLKLHLTFQSKQLLLSPQLKDKGGIFLNKNKKYKIQEEFIKYSYKGKKSIKRKDQDQEEEVVGSIGIGENGAVYQILKKVLKSNGAKIEIKHKDGTIVGIGQSCKYPVFLPLMITLSQSNTHSYSIDTFSTHFYPDSSFLRVIQQPKSPFQASKSYLKSQLTLSLRDRVLSIPISQLLTCGKYSSSDSYECQVIEMSPPQVGGLLFQFDPIFCGKGVQLDNKKEQEWVYCWSHVVLMILQFALLACLVKEDRVANMVNSALGLKKQ